MRIIIAISINSIIFSPVIAFAQTGKWSLTTADKYVAVDGHKMHYHVAGSGSPTVIFESGVTDDLNSWNAVYSEVSQFTKTVCYDRMGIGSSEAPSAARSFTQLATELHSLLHNAGLLPPYILVGHSMGGPIIRAFAYLYEHEIAGMIFLDCMTEFDIKGVPKDTLDRHLPPESVGKSNNPVEKELYLLRTEVLSDFRETRSFNPLPDVPIHVFVGQKNVYPELVINRIEWYTKTISSQTESSLTVLPYSSHRIQDDYPGLVVTAIHKMLFPNAENVLRKILQEKGVDSCIGQYKKMKTNYLAGLITEGTLNKLGYEMLRAGKKQEALKLFSLNVKMYPKSFNTYDSLGEAYKKAGNKKDAIKNYKMSLALNPSNTNAQKILKELK